jgi:hypothetical protein
MMVVPVVRFLLRPLGYLLFVAGLLVLSMTAWLLGERDELGYFAGRLVRMIWRYPEVTRKGVRIAWLGWAALFGVALSPADPITSRWDEVALAAVALLVLWHQRAFVRRGGD